MRMIWELVDQGIGNKVFRPKLPPYVARTIENLLPRSSANRDNSFTAQKSTTASDVCRFNTQLDCSAAKVRIACRDPFT